MNKHLIHTFQMLLNFKLSQKSVKEVQKSNGSIRKNQLSTWVISVNTFIAWRKKWEIESRTIENVTRWDRRVLDDFWRKHGVRGYM